MFSAFSAYSVLLTADCYGWHFMVPVNDFATRILGKLLQYERLRLQYSFSQFVDVNGCVDDMIRGVH